MAKRCPLCGAYLDPAEHCDCDREGPQDTVEIPRVSRKPKARKMLNQIAAAEGFRQEWFER